jgi:hypothetical protein
MLTGNYVTKFNHSLEEMYCVVYVTEYILLNDIKILNHVSELFTVMV